ncbi:MAG: ATP-binding protein [Bacteroidales bacterium]
MDFGKLKIVAIDDNRDNLVTFQALIREAFPGASFFPATDGSEGLELTELNDPDVVLLATLEKGPDAFEICRRIKSDPLLREIPVVFLTELNGDKADRIKALDAGAEAFLAKPVDALELRAQFKAMARIKMANVSNREERKNLEQLITESESRFYAIFRESPVPASLLRFNGLRLLEVNNAWLGLTGYSCEESIGHTIGELGLIDKNVRWDLVNKYDNDGSIRDEMISLTTRSGENRDVILSVVPLTLQGEACGIIHMVDVTESKNNERALCHWHELMRYIIEHDRSAIAVHDKDCRYIYVSKRYLSDYKVREEDVIGKHHYEVFPDLPEKWREAHRRALDGEVTGAEDDPYYKDDGTVEWTRWECRPWFEANGEIGGFIVYTELITERKNIELQLMTAKEKAQESDRLKTAFLANMSHEIRTPMNGILGFAQILRDPRLNEEQKKHFIDVIEKSGQRLLNLISDIIDVSKIESGHQELYVSEVSVHETLNDMWGFFAPIFEKEKPGVELSVDLPKEDIRFVTDRDKLHSVLTNLIRNAEKFTREGRVVFGCFREDDTLIWYVKDTGIGIAADQQTMIFERFYQVDDSFSRGHEGAGLGLSICKAFVEMMGGRIWLTSESGRGAEFRFSLSLRHGEGDCE